MSPENSLGPLEADIMQVVWERQKVTVQDVFEVLSEERSIAYNTIMTVMSRLAQKGILTRAKSGRSFVYSPTTTKSEVAKGMLQYIIDKIFKGSKAPVFSHLLEDADLSKEEVAYLEELVKGKKREE
ncbi:MAG: CopY family transcriptional regulator [Firmicutes bacterium HGW-Firmicutes-14]|nr:MAG: CopY family transcriptional regulator [Firmicutes bacterium HGW-Firmicutes-14]